MFRTRVNVVLLSSVRSAVGGTALLTACLFGRLAHAQATCDPSTVSYWRFDGDFTDSCGSSDGSPVGNASIVTSNCVSCPLDNAGCLALNGDPDYVNLLAPFSVGSLSQGTIEAWVKLESSESVVILHHATPFRTDIVFWIKHVAGVFSLGLHMNGGAMDDIEMPDFGVSSWHHVAYTWDGSEMCAYLDGKLLACMPNSDFPLFNQGSAVADIGRNIAGNSYFIGNLDAIRLSNAVLDPSQFLLCQNIPTVSEWGLVVMSLLVLTAGAVVLKRRLASQA